MAPQGCERAGVRVSVRTGVQGWLLRAVQEQEFSMEAPEGCARVRVRVRVGSSGL